MKLLDLTDIWVYTEHSPHNSRGHIFSITNGTVTKTVNILGCKINNKFLKIEIIKNEVF